MRKSIIDKCETTFILTVIKKIVQRSYFSTSNVYIGEKYTIIDKNRDKRTVKADGQKI